jgi:PQQ-dependent catabolism-associated CXXCW motif protein
MKYPWFATIIIMALFAVPRAWAEEPPPEPEGYRLGSYHAPTPATLKGATVIDTERTFEIWTKKEAAFIDALSRPSRPADLPKEVIWRPSPRHDIPGSLWLPDTGLGELTPALQNYFESGLARASGNDKSKALVFYCRTNCWASWNAAKRALTLGYKNVSWYPGGADAWEKAGHPLEERPPEPMEEVR